MLKFVKKFVREDDGVTAVEYSVLAVLIIGILIAAIPTLQTGLTNAFTAIGTKLATA